MLWLWDETWAREADQLLRSCDIARADRTHVIWGALSAEGLVSRNLPGVMCVCVWAAARASSPPARQLHTDRQGPVVVAVSALLCVCPPPCLGDGGGGGGGGWRASNGRFRLDGAVQETWGAEILAAYRLKEERKKRELETGDRGSALTCARRRYNPHLSCATGGIRGVVRRAEGYRLNATWRHRNRVNAEWRIYSFFFKDQ